MYIPQLNLNYFYNNDYSSFAKSSDNYSANHNNYYISGNLNLQIHKLPIHFINDSSIKYITIIPFVPGFNFSSNFDIQPKIDSCRLPTHRRGAHRKFLPFFLLILKSKFWPYVTKRQR